MTAGTTDAIAMNAIITKTTPNANETEVGKDLNLKVDKRLKDLTLIPPGGWRWTCQKHGTKLVADFFPELLAKVNGYLRANEIVIHGDRVAWLQNQMCEQNGWGPEICYTLGSTDLKG